ncbi:MAG: protein-glutamate O-methyltransferase CheR [Myxococcota bacterium]
MLTTAQVPMTLEEFRLFRTLLLSSAGLSFDEGAKDRLERRLQERLQVTGCRDFTDYYLKLRHGVDGAAELERMLENCVTHETYFFREPRQLRALDEEIIPEIVGKVERDRLRRRLRIWSAGCSSGEEAYTLAIMLLRHPLLRGWELEVVGTDLSRRALARARRAVYGRSSFRDIDPALLERYFTPLSGAEAGNHEVKPEVRALVTLGRVNLWADGEVCTVGRLDVILCRNVLIYFDREGKRKVIESFHERLKPGGYLLLGHSENLLHVATRFETVSLAHDLVYRRNAPDPFADAPPRGRP